LIWLLAVAALGVLYPYVIYPLLLNVVSRFLARPSRPGSDLPSVAILVSAFNEEARIREKIGNFEALDYPADRLELWIGSDGSTDGTADVVRASANHRIHLLERSTRTGKTSVLNELARRARADVFIFTDVNALFRPQAVSRLAAVMADPTAGVVSGRTVIRAGDGNVEVEGSYYRMESWLKLREGGLGWLPGADGAIYALRAALYRDLPEELINDLAHPCQVVAQGFAARFEPAAISEESAGDDAEREFHRQTRMTAQSAYLLASFTRELLRTGRFGMLWVLVSHKWLRWIAAVWMVTGAVALAAVSAPAALAVALLILITLAAWRAGVRAAAMPVFFLLIHFAYLRGLWHAVKGERYVTWKPRAA
jgi:cellulose synthase/poly-beta-1,6-N-acetylglucosamine synthase-like glycosyltransferase